MSRFCCIKQCGNFQLKKKKNNCTLFEVPKDPEKQSLWLKAIGPQLKKGKSTRKHLYVCNYHFKEDDFFTSSTVILKNGEETCLPRQKLRLRASSIPSIFKITNNQSTQVVPTSKNNRAKSKRSTGKKKGKTEDGQSQKQDLHQVWIKLERDADMSDSSSSSHPDNISEYTRKVEPKKPDLELPKHTCGKMTTGLLVESGNRSLPEKRPLLPENRGQSPLFNTTMLINALESTSLPRHWGVSVIHLGVLFHYSGDSHAHISRSVLVKNDMTIEIRGKGAISQLVIVEKITCLQDVIFTLTTVAEMRFCKGPKDDVTCDDVFLKFDKKRKSERCNKCKLQRKREQDRLHKRKIRNTFVKRKQRMEMKNLKRKVKRMAKNQVLTDIPRSKVMRPFEGNGESGHRDFGSGLGQLLHLSVHQSKYSLKEANI